MSLYGVIKSRLGQLCTIFNVIITTMVVLGGRETCQIVLNMFKALFVSLNSEHIGTLRVLCLIT